MLNSLPGGGDRRHSLLVADRICALIEVDRITSGSRLPPERELALQFGVSRQSVREALSALEAAGRVEIRSGSGVYVCPAHLANAAAPALAGTAAELMEARMVLERDMISLAATRVSQAGLEAVSQALEAMREDMVAGRNPQDADRQFHLSIAEMAGNRALIGVAALVFDTLHGAISWKPDRRERAAAWRATLAEHEFIFQALQARDPVMASAALCSHLLATRGRLIDRNTS